MTNNGIKALHEIDLIKCRLCQENDGSIEFLTNSILCERILFCTKINIDNTDDNAQLPKQICTDCNQVLDNFMLFQEHCLKIDEQLKKLLTDTKPATAKRKLPPKRTPIESDDVLVKIESELPDTKSNESTPGLQDNASLYFLMADDNNEATNEIKVENPSDPIDEENCEGHFKYDILDEIAYDSEDDLEQQSQKVTNSLESTKKEIILEEATSSSNSGDDEDNLKRPIKKKPNSTPQRYVCDVIECGKTYSSKDSLRKHKYVKHNNNYTDFLCTTCGKHFSGHNSLKAHERTHDGTKPFLCAECNVGFAQAANLRKHIKLHHEGHRYTCSQCGKQFLSGCTLKRHKLIHIGIKDFKCDLCPSEFYTRKELLRHQKYHFDIRPHFCQICYKSFVVKYRLTEHMRSHTGERPYRCDVTGCTKRFMDSHTLQRHKRNVHRLDRRTL